jgi:hypothetical protein
MLAGGWSLWRSTNVKSKVGASAGPEWYEIKPPLGDEPARAKQSEDEWRKLFDETYAAYPISVIAVAPGDSNTIFVGHNNGQVWKTSNGKEKSPAWTQVGKDALPTRWCQAITINPHDKNRIYVGFIGFKKDNFWASNDGGQTWKRMGANLPDGAVRTIIVHPKNPNWIYIGTDSGVLTSENGGETFDPVNAGPATVRVSKLFWMGSKLVAATYGRGVYAAEVKAPQ